METKAKMFQPVAGATSHREEITKVSYAQILQEKEMLASGV